MTDDTQTPDAVLRSPMSSAQAMMVPAALWSAIAAPIIVAVIAVAVAIVRLLRGVPLEINALAVWSVGWTAMLFALLFGFRLFAVSRAFADSAFRVLGVMATFFGLAMLSVFLLQLGYEAYEWFTITPRLVEIHNAFLEDRVAEAENALKNRAAELEIEKKQALAFAANDEERKFIESEFAKGVPEVLADLTKNADENRKFRDTGMRTSTAPLSLFWYFLTNGPSSDPQNAGIWPALIGSITIALITILSAVPIGVGAAIYLEEYRANNLLGRLIQININNLAGVPSVMYGILGALVFVEWIFKPLERQFDWISARNTLGGGLTLALLTLPVIIVSAQEAIRAVPSSIRQGAYALGATRWQTIWRQVLPLSWPGILTGTILAVSRAIGEAAPLVLFGALLYVDQATTAVNAFFGRFTVLPMQIFGWADRPAIATLDGVPVRADGEAVEIWRSNAAMGCLVLLVMLLGLNAIAIVLRNRAQKRLKW